MRKGEPVRLAVHGGRLLVACLAVAAGCTQLELPTENVCFEKHVVPLIARDCRSCHENGEYGMRLRGRASDYPQVLDFVVPGSPGTSPFLTAGAGGGEHPAIWPEGSAEHATVAAWIVQGAVGPSCSAPPDDACGTDADCPGSEGDGGDSNTCDSGDMTSFELADAGGDDLPDIETAGEDRGAEIIELDEEPPPEVVEPTVSFSAQVSPIHKLDCAACHMMGQYGVKITGTPLDYPVVMKYVNVEVPEQSTWLWWAAGGGAHPVYWPKNGPKYNLFLQWVKEGAQNN